MLNVDELKALAAKRISQYSVACDVFEKSQTAVTDAENTLAATHEAQQIVQAVAETVQQEAHARIGGVVSRCLSIVFGEDAYRFEIHFERARGKTEARLVFVRDGMEVNPVDASGGGVVDVAAFALRLSCLMLSRPAQRRVVVLDEPFKFVSADYRDAVRRMLESLSSDLDVQFIMVTHIDELRCGKVVEIA